MASASSTGAVVVTRDSAGVSIIELRHDATHALPTWAVADDAVLSIGEAEGPSGYVLYRVAGAMRLHDGHIVIADGQAREFRLFDVTGAFLRATGGEGEGPGEFRAWQVISALDSTRVSIYDPVLARVTTIDFNGGIATRAVPHPRSCGAADTTAPGGRAWNCEIDGVLPDGSVIVRRMARGPRQLREGELTHFPAGRHVFMLLKGTVRFPLDSVPGTASVRVVGRQEGMNVPFWASEALYSPKGHAAYGARQLVFATSDRYEFRLYDTTGTLTRVVRSALKPAPVTKALLAERRTWADTATGVKPEARDYVRSLKPGGDVPFFSRILIDRTGRMWVQDYSPPPQLGGSTAVDWTVFTDAGMPLARVRGLDAERVLEIGEDYVLLRERDDVGVERVVLRTITTWVRE